LNVNQLFDEALSRRDFGKYLAAAAALAGVAPGVTAAAGSSAGALDFKVDALQEGGTGGTLTFARYADAVTLDPQYSFQGIALHVLYCIYDTLTAVDPVTQEVEGILAESWDISEDGLEYTFHLRQGITFHDGTPFTSEAITFAFERILGEASAIASASWVGAVTGATAIDDHTVKLTLSEPFSPLLGNLASGYFSIPSPTAVREKGDDYGHNPIGTGRWIFKEWIAGESITLVPNPDYKNFRSNSVNKGAATLDQLVFRTIPVAETQFAALETGEINMINPPEREVERMQADDAYEIVVSANSDGTTYLEFAMLEIPDGQFGAQWKAPFDDILVRQAVAYGVNADELIEKVLYGLADRNYGPMPTALFAYKPEIEEFGYKHDAEKAKSLLDQAGWVDSDGDGVREKNGAKLEILFWGASNSANEKISQILQSQLAQIGFKVNIELVESGTYLGSLPENKQDFNLTGWGQPEPDMLRGMTNGTWGVGRYRDETYQNLMTQTLQTTDRAERTELYFEAAKKMLADAAIVPLWSPRAVFAVRSNVKGVKLGTQNTVIYEDITIEE
jgi:peptide/nickel transport system substrate-binding protein